MKYLLLLLLTFNTFAAYEIKIKPSDRMHAKMKIDCKDQNKCDKELKRFIKQSKFKGQWNRTEAGSITSKTITNDDGQEITKYYHSEDFSIETIDKTSEIADKKAEADARKAEIQEIKAMKLKINNSDLPIWHKKLLKRLIKELKD